MIMRNEFYIALRRHIEINTKRAGYGGALTGYEIGHDEINDPSLVSQRLYGTRQHSDIVRIVCGTSFTHEPLPLKLFLFPSLNAIIQLQKRYEVTNA